MTVVRFGPGGRRIAGNHTVQFKRLWSDSWVAYPEAHCTEAVWACAPTMPTASIIWDYGVIKPRIFFDYTDTEKLDVSRWYVKITFVTDVAAGDTVVWYGVVSDIEDQQAGLVDAGTPNMQNPTGRQVLACYGLEYLLSQSDISSSFVYNGSAALYETPLPITFNPRGEGYGNRTAITHPATETGSYVFDGTPEDPTATSRPFWDDWSTRDIVGYLLRWKGPTNSSLSYSRSIPFELKYPERLDDTDAPVLHQEGATPLSLLYRLIDRRRMTSFFLEVDENTSPNTVKLVPFTLTPTVIEFGIVGTQNIPANLETRTLIYEQDELTTVAVRDVDVRKFDRVISRGARRTSTCTMFHDTDRFEAAWTSGNETAYESAASGETGYSGWDSLKKKQRNQEVRTHEALRSVFSWFRIPSDWDGLVEIPNGSAENPVFVDDDGNTVSQFVHGVTIQPYLPLYEGVDYSGTAIATGPASPRDKVYRRPFLTFKIPTDARYIMGEKNAQLAEGDADPVGDGKNNRWSAYARVQPDSRVLEVHVEGEPQHVIAETDFTKLTDDRDVGDFDYKNKEMFATVCLQECRYAQGSYPAAGEPDSSLIDSLRGLVIWAGDEYRRDYVVAGTIVDVDDDGTLSLAEGGYVTDDTDRLNVIARIAYEWYGQTRAVLTLSTYRLTNDLAVGDMVTTIGDATIVGNTHYQEINSPITQVRLRNPRGEGDSVPEPSMSFVTSAGELDTMTLVPPPSRRKERRR